MSERSALVTGCSSGLGRAIALRLRDRGWRVFATARAPDDLEALGALGLEPVRLELRDSVATRRAAAEVLDRSAGRLDALVNNAGYTGFGAVEDLTRDEIREQFETNVFGAVELTSTLLPALRRRPRATVVFVSSVCGRFAVPYFGGYCASKFALEAFADALRRETRGASVGVHVVEPGLFKTAAFARTAGAWRAGAGARASLHARRCEEVLAALARSLDALPEARAALVASAVEDFVEGRSRRARRVVPAASLVYEAAARLLPAEVQDLVVDWRGRWTRARAAER